MEYATAPRTIDGGVVDEDALVMGQSSLQMKRGSLGSLPSLLLFRQRWNC